MAMWYLHCSSGRRFLFTVEITRGTEITATKSLNRFCFLCGMNAMALAAKAKQGLDLHHMLEKKMKKKRSTTRAI